MNARNGLARELPLVQRSTTCRQGGSSAEGRVGLCTQVFFFKRKKAIRKKTIGRRAYTTRQPLPRLTPSTVPVMLRANQSERGRRSARAQCQDYLSRPALFDLRPGANVRGSRQARSPPLGPCRALAVMIPNCFRGGPHCPKLRDVNQRRGFGKEGSLAIHSPAPAAHSAPHAQDASPPCAHLARVVLE